MPVHEVLQNGAHLGYRWGESGDATLDTGEHTMYINSVAPRQPGDRTTQFHMLISDDEDRMLRALAEADGLTASDVLRQLIRREFMQRWPPKVKTKR